MKRLLIEASIVTVMVWLLYGLQEAAMMWLLCLLFVPVVLLTGLALGAYKKRRRR